MTEPVGLTVGLVGLASLFSTCVECFDYFQAAKEFPKKYALSLAKLDIEKTRLLAWGDAVGILRERSEGHSLLLGQEPIIKNILETIKTLLNDVTALQGKYGAKPEPTPLEGFNRNQDVLSSHSRFRIQLQNKLSKPSILTRTVWAIHDKARFGNLIDDLKELVNGLNAVSPWLQDRIARQNELTSFDIRSIRDLSDLRLIEEACSGVHEDWSSAASFAIEVSDNGTLDRHIKAWIPERAEVVEGTGYIGGYIYQPRNLADLQEEPRVKMIYDDQVRTFFVLTEPCLNQNAVQKGEIQSCDVSYARRCYDYSNPCHLAGLNHRWNLGRRISDLIVSGFDDHYNKEDVFHEYVNKESRSIMRDARKVAIARIYCAPCITLFKTANSICRGYYTSNHLEFRICVDDRLPTICCGSDAEIKRERLRSLLRESEASERDGDSSGHRDFLDRPWLESRIYAAEEEEDISLLPKDFRKSYTALLEEYLTAEGLPSSDYPCQTVVLSEAHTCLNMIDCFGCKPQARMPRLGEIWQLRSQWEPTQPGRHDGGRIWKRRYCGNYAPSALALQKRQELLTVAGSTKSSEGHDHNIPSPMSLESSHRTFHLSSSSSKRRKASSSTYSVIED